MAIYTHDREEQAGRVTRSAQSASDASTQDTDEYYLVRVVHTSRKSLFDFWRPHQDVHYYELPHEGSYAGKVIDAPSTGFLDHYNRVNNVMFGQLDPYYWPALRRRSEAREARQEASDAAQLLPPTPSRDRSWKEIARDPLPSQTPMAAMQRGHATERSHSQDKSHATEPSKSSAPLESRPPYLLLTTVGLFGAAFIARALKTRRRLTWARADARAWRKMAMSFVEQKNALSSQVQSKVQSAAPVLASRQVAANLASNQKEQHVPKTPGDAQIDHRRGEYRQAWGSAAPVASTSTKSSTPVASTLPTNKAVHPHEDWDWTPADFPPRRNWRQQRLPPWCIGFSSTPRANSNSLEGGEIASKTSVGAVERAANKPSTSTNLIDDECFIVETLRDVYGIEACPSVESHTSIGNTLRSESSPKPAPPTSRIDKAISAHKGADSVGGEGHVLSVCATTRLPSALESMAYDHEELVREVLDDQGRARRQRLRSRLATRLVPRKARAQGKVYPTIDVLAEQQARKSLAQEDDDVGYLLASDYICAIHDRQDIVQEIAVNVSTKTPAGKKDVKRTKARSATLPPSDEQQRVRDLERQVWALLARVEAAERRS